ncbi:MAG: hypothetical protein K2J90_13745 [Lachnospiraceae bacterium]|nr:hypothetical protein [Lachnospiraceae bacterium]
MSTHSFPAFSQDAGDEPGSPTSADIWRMLRGSNTPSLRSGLAKRSQVMSRYSAARYLTE